MKSSLRIHLSAVLAAATLAACTQQPGGSLTPSAPGAAPASSTSTPVISAAPAKASTASLPGDHAATPHYKIAIDLPALPDVEEPLTDALRATANNAKRGFVQDLPDSRQSPGFANRRFALLLDFKIAANTSVFTSVRETGMQDTGGAHPAPVEATFVFDRKAGKLITLDDLFRDPDAARKVLANFAHEILLKKFEARAPKPGEGSPVAIREWNSNMRQMLDAGTQPTTLNYSVFVVRAGASQAAPSPGLTLIFPPYQVAPYAEGTQTVEVPASVFAKFLRQAYTGAFAR